MDIERDIIELFFIYFETMEDIAMKYKLTIHDVKTVLMNFKNSNDGAVLF